MLLVRVCDHTTTPLHGCTNHCTPRLTTTTYYAEPVTVGSEILYFMLNQRRNIMKITIGHIFDKWLE